MRLCKHCKVRVELVERVDGEDVWMHKVNNNSLGPPTMYLECTSTTVAEP